MSSNWRDLRRLGVGSWSGISDLRRGPVSELPEVLTEHAGEFLRLLVICFRIRPSLARTEYVSWHAGRLTRVSLSFIPNALSMHDLRFDSFDASAIVSET